MIHIYVQSPIDCQSRTRKATLFQRNDMSSNDYRSSYSVKTAKFLPRQHKYAYVSLSIKKDNISNLKQKIHSHG